MKWEHRDTEGINKRLPPEKYQTEADLVDEIDRRLPFRWLNDFTPPMQYPGRNLGAIAQQHSIGAEPLADSVKVGQFFYPNNAGRWSVFRYFATGSEVKAMIAKAQTPKLTPQTLFMQAIPVGTPVTGQANFTVSTPMYMLPARPLADYGNGFDGLFLVTLVDERFYWQWKNFSHQTFEYETWTQLINSVASFLGITVTIPTIAAVYQQPEQDSQLWMNRENAAMIMDAAAWNCGLVFVRNLDGSYQLQTKNTAQAQVSANRALSSPVNKDNVPARMAGGSIFTTNPTGKSTAGSLAAAKNSVVPASVDVCFPAYIFGDDPVPHFSNSRYENQRQSCWFEESFGDVWVVNVPASSGGVSISGYTPDTAGLQTQYAHAIHTPAKALYSGEIQYAAGSGSPMNASGLIALAMQVAGDYYFGQTVSPSLDECYPGTVNWTPEGIDDVLWTFSARERQASTRVMRQEWNQTVHSLQPSTPTISGVLGGVIPLTNTPRGVGGPSVAQTWRMLGQMTSGQGFSTTVQAITSGTFNFTLNAIDNLPTQNRWYGTVNSGLSDHEDVLLEGTSGGTSVGIVHRGDRGTVQQAHGNGATLTWDQSNPGYGINAIALEKMLFGYPRIQSSGGIAEYVLVGQTQTVRLFDGSGVVINSIRYFSGQVNPYDPTQAGGSEYPAAELIWVRERNGNYLSSGARYDGQFAGYTISGPSQVAPLYLTNQTLSSGTSTPFQLTSGIITSGYIGDKAVNSGNISSGAVGPMQIASGAVGSGRIGSGAVQGSWISGLPNNIVSGTIGPYDLASGTIFAGPGISVTIASSGITISNSSGAGGAGTSMVGCRALLTDAVAISVGATIIPMSGEDYDLDTMHQQTSTSGGSSRIYFNTSGYYRISYGVVAVVSGAPVSLSGFPTGEYGGTCQAAFRKNGSITIPGTQSKGTLILLPDGAVTTLFGLDASTDYLFQPPDYIELVFTPSFQNALPSTILSGGAMTASQWR